MLYTVVRQDIAAHNGYPSSPEYRKTRVPACWGPANTFKKNPGTLLRVIRDREMDLAATKTEIQTLVNHLPENRGVVQLEISAPPEHAMCEHTPVQDLQQRMDELDKDNTALTQLYAALELEYKAM